MGLSTAFSTGFKDCVAVGERSETLEGNLSTSAFAGLDRVRAGVGMVGVGLTTLLAGVGSMPGNLSFGPKELLSEIWY